MKKVFTGRIFLLAMGIMLILGIFSLPGGVHAAAAGAADTATVDAEYFKSVMDMITENYNGEVTEAQLTEGALKGMFNSMDPYTAYFTMEEAEGFFSSMNGMYEGIGVMIEKNEDAIVIVKVFPASPSERAGILPGDRIAAVDGKNVVGASTEEVVSLIKGDAGTKVALGIIRAGETGLLEIEVERGAIKINPVTYEIRDGIGWIRLETFNANAYEFMAEALHVMDQKRVDKIILDLRDNPGGEVSQAVMIAEKFVPEGLIARLDFKTEAIPDEEYYSYLEKPKYKLAVLVNGMTASASEILAGALQDTDSGTLIGTRTFGKAKVQNLIPVLTPAAFSKYQKSLNRKIVSAFDLMASGVIPGEDEILGYTKITTGTYTTPKGRMIDGKGLTPDVPVADPDLAEGIDIRGVVKLSKASKLGLDSKGVDIYNAEKILKLLGYDVDDPDMRLDKKTFGAIWKFRVDCGLYPGGVLDFTTQDHLNKKLDEMVLKLDGQLAKAVELLKNLQNTY